MAKLFEEALKLCSTAESVVRVLPCSLRRRNGVNRDGHFCQRSFLKFVEIRRFFPGLAVAYVLNGNEANLLCPLCTLKMKGFRLQMGFRGRIQGATGVTSHALPQREKIILQRITYLRLQC